MITRIGNTLSKIDAKGTYQIWYHGGCNDGLMSAAVTYSWLRNMGVPKENIMAEPVSYRHTPKPFNNPHGIFIVDFSIDPELLNQYALQVGEQSGGFVLTIDHHDSALSKHSDWLVSNRAAENNLFIFDNNYSGAGLCYALFYDSYPDQSVLPDAVADVQDRDLWKFERPNSREFHLFLLSLKLEDRYSPDYVSNYFMDGTDSMMQAAYNSAVEIGSSMKSMFDLTVRNIAEEAATGTLIDGEGNQIKTIFCNVSAYMFISDTADHIIKYELLRSDEPFVVMLYNVAKDGAIKLSFRSADGKSNGLAKRFAELFGGGGHPNSGGAYTTLERLAELLPKD